MSETVYAGTVGKLEEFDPKSDTMTAYIERAMFFFDANNTPGDKRAATFLRILFRYLFRNLMLPEKVYGKSLDQVTKVLLNHYEPKPLVISECFNYNRRNQEPNESIQDYIAELRRLTVHCDYTASSGTNGQSPFTQLERKRRWRQIKKTLR